MWKYNKFLNSGLNFLLNSGLNFACCFLQRFLNFRLNFFLNFLSRHDPTHATTRDALQESPDSRAYHMCSMSVVRVSFISQLLGTSIFCWFHHFLFENDLWDDWDDRSARNEPPEVSWKRFGDQAPELLKMSLQRPPESDLATRPQNCWKWVSRGGK